MSKGDFTEGMRGAYMAPQSKTTCFILIGAACPPQPVPPSLLLTDLPSWLPPRIPQPLLYVFSKFSSDPQGNRSLVLIEGPRSRSSI